MSGRTWYRHDSGCFVYMSYEEVNALDEILIEVDELEVPAVEQEKELAYLGLHALPPFLYHDGPPDPVYDACRLMGIGEWATSEFRGNADFATTLERRYSMKVWRAAIQRALEIQAREQATWAACFNARRAAGIDEMLGAPVQFILDFGGPHAC